MNSQSFLTITIYTTRLSVQKGARGKYLVNGKTSSKQYTGLILEANAVGTVAETL